MSLKARAEFIVRQVTPILDELSMDAMLYLRASQSVGRELSDALLVHLITNYCAKHALTLPKKNEFSAAALRQLEAEIASLKMQLDEENSALDAVRLKRKH